MTNHELRAELEPLYEQPAGKIESLRPIIYHLVRKVRVATGKECTDDDRMMLVYAMKGTGNWGEVIEVAEVFLRMKSKCRGIFEDEKRMTTKERSVKAESIIRRQDSGKITKEQASAEFDALLDDCGDLHYYSDTTMMREVWEGQAVMVMNGTGSSLTERKRSDVGLITQGPRRGEFVNRPGTTGIESANPDCLAHFGYKAK